MRRCYFGLVLGLTSAVSAASASAQTTTAPDDGFEARQYQDAAGATLLYRLLKPGNYDPAKGELHPLLIFLHGAGERGNDNQAQLKHGRKMMLAAAGTYGGFVLAPQCPNGQKWVDVDWGKPSHEMPRQPAESMRLVLEVAAKLQKEFRIDPDRIYVMGLSMGGYGTWDAIQRYPDLFAAAVPICGGGDASQAARIKITIWAFHGAKDGAVPVKRSRDMIEAIKAAGGNPKYTEIPEVGHNVWDNAFSDPEMLKWLFAQKRPRK